MSEPHLIDLRWSGDYIAPGRQIAPEIGPDDSVFLKPTVSLISTSMKIHPAFIHVEALIRSDSILEEKLRLHSIYPYELKSAVLSEIELDKAGCCIIQVLYLPRPVHDVVVFTQFPKIARIPEFNYLCNKPLRNWKPDLTIIDAPVIQSAKIDEVFNWPEYEQPNKEEFIADTKQTLLSKRRGRGPLHGKVLRDIDIDDRAEKIWCNFLATELAEHKRKGDSEREKFEARCKRIVDKTAAENEAAQCKWRDRKAEMDRRVKVAVENALDREKTILKLVYEMMGRAANQVALGLEV